jgi:uncharacterized surface protein with fasciclin (FAS1) repeats
MRLQKLAVAAAAVSVLGMTASCGDDSTAGAAGDDTNSSDSSTPMGGSGTTDAMDPAADLVGPGCADYASQVPDGAGSVAGMAKDPVAVAAGNNPLLKTLVAAVSGKLNPKVNLVDTLNGDEFTVFAPVDSAFAEIPAKTIKTLQKDDELLTTILTYHVVPGRIAPDDLAGMQTTVQGSDVDVTGSGDALMVNDANVVCGGVQTENATVYLIDSVLMPTM